MPKARNTGLAIQKLEDEILVYDKDRDVAHCLTGAAAQVWEAADGSRSAAGLADLVGLTNVEAEELVAELAEKGLFEASGPVDGISRRQLVGRMAATAGAAGLVLSVAAPTASATHTGCTPNGGNCTQSSQCCSHNCHTNGKCNS